jgi:FkbM family methyltransferase
MIANCLVIFYRFWHGRLGLKGAGFLLRITAPFLKGLQTFQLKLDEGHFVTIDWRDVSASYWLNSVLQDKFEEEALLIAIAKFSYENCSIWDCGANCGLLSYNLARMLPNSHIAFFEPNPKMFSIAKDGNAVFENVTGYQIALSDSLGSVNMIVPYGGSTTATLEANKTKRTGYSISVECQTGDNFIEKHGGPFPDIIKIDTEGHEASVIRGLKHIITAKKPIIFFEHISLTDSEIKGIIPDNYDIYAVINSNGSLEKGFKRHLGHNSALIPKDFKLGKTSLKEVI